MEMVLRILSGRLKGKLLQISKQTRPTAGIVRKSIFDILRDIIRGAHFLDLFAGSGALGIEAISCGAAHSTFVDQQSDAIRENLKNLEIENQAVVISSDALDAIELLKKRGKHFNIIYADPPYAQKTICSRVISWLENFPLLSEDGIFFLEKPLSSPVQQQLTPFSQLKLYKQRSFGDTIIEEYRFQSTEAGK